MPIATLTALLVLGPTFGSVAPTGPRNGGYEPIVAQQNSVAPPAVDTNLQSSPRQTAYDLRLATGSQNPIAQGDTAVYTFEVLVIDSIGAGGSEVTHAATASDVIKPTCWSNAANEYDVEFGQYNVAPAPTAGLVFGKASGIQNPGIANGDIDTLQFLNANQNIELRLTYLRGGTYAVHHPVATYRFRVPTSGDTLLSQLKMSS